MVIVFQKVINGDGASSCAGDEPCDWRLHRGEDRGPVQQRRAGPGLRDGVQEDRHQRAGLPDGPPQRRLPVRQLLN
jgi:hypothetical protein